MMRQGIAGTHFNTMSADRLSAAGNGFVTATTKPTFGKDANRDEGTFIALVDVPLTAG
jgi:hypothetical protein